MDSVVHYLSKAFPLVERIMKALQRTFDANCTQICNFICPKPTIVKLLRCWENARKDGKTGFYCWHEMFRGCGKSQIFGLLKQSVANAIMRKKRVDVSCEKDSMWERRVRRMGKGVKGICKTLFSRNLCFPELRWINKIRSERNKFYECKRQLLLFREYRFNDQNLLTNKVHTILADCNNWQWKSLHRER